MSIYSHYISFLSMNIPHDAKQSGPALGTIRDLFVNISSSFEQCLIYTMIFIKHK